MFVDYNFSVVGANLVNTMYNTKYGKTCQNIPKAASNTLIMHKS